MENTIEEYKNHPEVVQDKLLDFFDSDEAFPWIRYKGHARKY